MKRRTRIKTETRRRRKVPNSRRGHGLIRNDKFLHQSSCPKCGRTLEEQWTSEGLLIHCTKKCGYIEL